MMNKKTVYLICSLLLGMKLQAQQHTVPAVKNAPIAFEQAIANNGGIFQIILNKKFQTIPNLGIFSITHIINEWGTREIPSFMNQSSLFYEVFKNFRVTGGYHYSNGTNFNPTGGISYLLSNENWLINIYPRTTFDSTLMIETLAFLQYTPKINEKYRFYSRIQALHGYQYATNLHSRSYVMLRAGIKLQEFTVGLAANIDYYGPQRLNENNFGVFFSAPLL